MSLIRLVYYSAMISAWAAFLGWGVSECARSCVAPDPETTSKTVQVLLGFLIIAVTSAVTGGAIGLGLNVLGGMANGRWQELARRAWPGFLGGCLGGVAGGMVGGVMFYEDLPRAIGWMVLGLAVGVVEGVYDRSFRKIRNGLVGGAIGGFVGGLLFDWIYNLGLTASGRSSRAAAFVVLGLSIGAAIGLAHVVFRVAWLTVVDGFRTGRQLNLTQSVTILGRGDHLPLPFLGPTNKDLEAEHLTIRRMPDGSYCLEDNHSKLGTRLNSQPLTGRRPEGRQRHPLGDESCAFQPAPPSRRAAGAGRRGRNFAVVSLAATATAAQFRRQGFLSRSQALEQPAETARRATPTAARPTAAATIVKDCRRNATGEMQTGEMRRLLPRGHDDRMRRSTRQKSPSQVDLGVDHYSAVPLGIEPAIQFGQRYDMDLDVLAGIAAARAGLLHATNGEQGVDLRGQAGRSGTAHGKVPVATFVAGLLEQFAAGRVDHRLAGRAWIVAHQPGGQIQHAAVHGYTVLLDEH